MIKLYPEWQGGNENLLSYVPEYTVTDVYLKVKHKK